MHLLSVGQQAGTSCPRSAVGNIHNNANRIAPEVLLDEELGYTFKADNWR